MIGTCWKRVHFLHSFQKLYQNTVQWWHIAPGRSWCLSVAHRYTICDSSSSEVNVSKSSGNVPYIFRTFSRLSKSCIALLKTSAILWSHSGVPKHFLIAEIRAFSFALIFTKSDSVTSTLCDSWSISATALCIPGYFWSVGILFGEVSDIFLIGILYIIKYIL